MIDYEISGQAIRLREKRKIIGGVVQLPAASIDAMVARKHDTEFQLSLCREMMSEGSILPYQVQDFAVQVAGGTSATRALAQQLPQLLSGSGFGVFYSGRRLQCWCR